MIITETLPQTTEEIKTISLREVVKLLPYRLPWKINVWLGGKLARFGITTDALIFLAEMDEEPSVEMRMFFEKLIPFPATIIEDWKSQKWQAIRLYNEGRLIIDKEVMVYRELPTPVYEATVLTIEELKEKLPHTIPYKQNISLTGGLVKNGFSANDVDFICFEEKDKTQLREMAKYFTDILGWKTDVGNEVMPEREPVYCFKIYEKGICQLQ